MSGWQNTEDLQRTGVWALFVAAGNHRKGVSVARKCKGSGEKA